MKYYIDFDSTMFDTNTFVNDFYSILMKYNLNPKEMFKTNEKLYNGKAVDYLNIIEYYTKDKTYYNELDIIKLCRHPNIISFKGHYEDNEYIYLVTEYLSGGTL